MTKPMTPAERAHHATDETGYRDIIFRGSIEISDGVKPPEVHARTVRFRITHHVDWSLDFVDVITEHPDRRCDLFDDHSPAGGTLIATLGAIIENCHEQERRITGSRNA